MFFSHAFSSPFRAPPSAHGAESVEMLQVKKKKKRRERQSRSPGASGPSSSRRASISWEGPPQWSQPGFYRPRRLGSLNKLWIRAAGFVPTDALTLHPAAVQPSALLTGPGAQRFSWMDCSAQCSENAAGRTIKSPVLPLTERLKDVPVRGVYRRPLGSGWVNQHPSRAGPPLTSVAFQSPPLSGGRLSPPGHVPCWTVKSSREKSAYFNPGARATVGIRPALAPAGLLEGHAAGMPGRLLRAPPRLLLLPGGPLGPDTRRRASDRRTGQGAGRADSVSLRTLHL